jgi:hypothetical protein
MWHAWGRGEVVRSFWLAGPKGSDHWEYSTVGGRITLRCILGIDEANWFRLAQDRVQW